jgi:hypothetical protein
MVFFAWHSFSQDNCVSIPDIDGLTTASEMFKIVSGQACHRQAKITWWDNYSNGNIQELRYGTTTSYGTTINLKPFTRRTNITTTIPDLTPNTKYYAQFYRVYNNNTKPLAFTFSTSEFQSAIVPMPSGPSYSLELGNRFSVINEALHFPMTLSIGDKVVISNVKGKRIFGYVHEMDISRIKMPALPSGIYIVSLLRSGRQLLANQIVIGSDLK